MKKNKNNKSNKQYASLNRTNVFSFDLISKYRSVIMGIAILWVVLFHSSVSYGFLINSVARLGNIGVDIFLFLSGIGLFFSYERLKTSNNSMLSFYKKRLLRIMPPTIIFLSLWFLYSKSSETIFRFILDITSLSFWIDGENPGWYIAFAIVTYLLYPLIHHFLIREKKILSLSIMLIIVLISNAAICYFFPSYYYKVELALGRLPIFIIGCYMALLVKNKKEIPLRFIPICALIAFLGVLLYVFFAGSLKYYSINRYVYCIITINLVLVFSSLLDYINKICPYIVKILEELGKYTLEIYITHTQILKFLTENLEKTNLYIVNLLSIVLSFLCAIIYNKLVYIYKSRKRQKC